MSQLDPARWRAPEPRLPLAHLPTPLQHVPALGEVWIKRDDMTGGPEAGNKLRKLEFLAADAQAQGADTLLTCGGIQSNHARATAIVAARLGLSCRLYLRLVELEGDGGEGVPLSSCSQVTPSTGNLFLDHFVGAEVRLITQARYRERDELMARAAAGLRDEGRRPYIIPEGGSNARGALGYVAAMAEVAQQMKQLGLPPFDTVVHACGSGGTAAGVIAGAGAFGVASAVRVMVVCDDAATFRVRIQSLIEDLGELAPSLPRALALWEVDDAFKGPAYAVSTPAQRAAMRDVARRTGIVLDPVYSGKAMHGLLELSQGPLRGRRVLFIHTGGLPGLLAQANQFVE